MTDSDATGSATPSADAGQGEVARTRIAELQAMLNDKSLPQFPNYRPSWRAEIKRLREQLATPPAGEPAPGSEAVVEVCRYPASINRMIWRLLSDPMRWEFTAPGSDRWVTSVRPVDEGHVTIAIRLAEAQAELARLQAINGLWCAHHQMLDGCGLAKESGRATIAERSLAAAEQARDEAFKLLWRCRTALESAHDGRLGADLREVVLKDLNAALLAGVAR